MSRHRRHEIEALVIGLCLGASLVLAAWVMFADVSVGVPRDCVTDCEALALADVNTELEDQRWTAWWVLFSLGLFCGLWLLWRMTTSQTLWKEQDD